MYCLPYHDMMLFGWYSWFDSAWKRGRGIMVLFLAGTCWLRLQYGWIVLFMSPVQLCHTTNHVIQITTSWQHVVFCLLIEEHDWRIRCLQTAVESSGRFRQVESGMPNKVSGLYFCICTSSYTVRLCARCVTGVTSLWIALLALHLPFALTYAACIITTFNRWIAKLRLNCKVRIKIDSATLVWVVSASTNYVQELSLGWRVLAGDSSVQIFLLAVVALLALLKVSIRTGFQFDS